MVVNIQDDILKLHAMGLLDRLLQDKATKGNILWATDVYAHLGDGYSQGNEIRAQRITGSNSDLIKTRARRAMEQRTERTRQHAEVFTPLWVVKKMNDVADVEWFGRKDGIHKLTGNGKIAFTKEKTWKKYVDARRLEITTGEAPFLVTRYDVETGEAIPVEERIGLLDRKLRAVSENAADLEEWKTWALRAVQSIYGYELQGDNLLIARVNILCSVEEHMMHRWRKKPEKDWLEKLCNVICWNLWQMDGIKGCLPVPPQPTEEQLCLFPPLEPLYEQSNLFGETEQNNISCRLFDWRGDHSISYQTLQEKGSEIMKFDFIIGNPPYQDDVENQGDRPNPIYDKFMDEAFKIADVVELIHPARFLFNAGQTSKQWNQKMLNDEHFTVLHYEPDASTIFSNTDIKGGIAISLRNTHENYGAIETFTSFPELNDIVRKVSKVIGSANRLNSIIASQGLYRFSQLFFDEHPEATASMGKGTGSKIVSSVMEKLPDVFLDEKPDFNAYVKLLGRSKNQRVWKWIKREYLEENAYLDSYNLLIPEANNSGKYGETLTEPSFAQPGEGSSDTFLCAGVFASREETINLAKYIKCKFFRALLGVKKVTQHCPPPVWAMIPLQDFTPASDIDWSKSIPEIDQQLYAKYGLDDAEIAFIETHVKEMS